LTEAVTVSESSEQYSVIGKRIPKYDSLLKVTGTARYMIDLKLHGMLYGKVLRSRHPHARILKIETGRAESIPGVQAVITAADTPRIRFGFLKDNLPLKEGVVLSRRDEIAAVAAVDEQTAQRAIDLIEVEYQKLPAIFDPVDAAKEGAPILHDEVGSNVVELGFNFRSVVAREPVSIGKDLVTVEGSYRIPFVTHTALGTMGALASYDADGTLTVWANTQAPFMFQRDMAQALGMPADKVRVVQPFIGGSFGRGMDLYPLDIIAAILSMKTRKPVKILLSREEDLEFSPTRQPVLFKITTTAHRNGRLHSRKIDAMLDLGPYVSWGAFDARVMMATASGQYRVPEVEFTSRHVYTNNPYSGTMRGAGNPQVNFAIETQMDILAEKLALDPVEFRAINANRSGDVTPQGMRITTCGMEESLRVAASSIGWKGRHREGRGTGIGFSSLFHVAGGARVYKSDGCGTIIKIDDFGTATVITGASEIGTGSDTSISQIVAEELSIPLSKVRIVNSDTAIKPWDVGIHASRMTFVGGNSALLAARDAKRKILELASEVLGEPVSRLVLRDGTISSSVDEKKSIEYSKLLRQAHFQQEGSVIMASAFYDPPNENSDEETQIGNISAAYGFGTQAALVDVDEETGKVHVRKVVAVHDAGRIINPVGAEGQVQGGVVMALSIAMTEQLLLEEGAVLNPSFADYKLPTSGDVPEIEVHFVGEPDPMGPFGAKGVGEHGVIPTAAAVANAIYDAVGARLYEIPMTPEKVLRAIRERG